MKRYTLMTAAALAVGGFAYTGCDRDETASNNPNTTNAPTPARTGDTAGDKVDRALDRTGDVAGNAVDKTAEATKDAGGKLADATERAGDGLREATRDTADSTGRAADRAGDNLREGARDVRDSAQQAGARIGDRADQGTAAAPDAEGIRDVLAIVTEAALTENGLDDLTERLADADRNRIGSAIGADFPEHAALVKQFRADWKAKYNQEFDVKEAQAYPEAMFSIRQGEIGGAAPSGAEVATGQRAGDLDANRERGRNIAAVTLAASQGKPGLSVPLIHEAPDAWKIDAPDSLTADKLRNNVMAHLKAAHAMKAQWPADVNQAHAAVTRHVLMAILDQPVQQK